MEIKSLLTPQKMNVLEDCVLKTRELPGDLAEFGVYRGGTALRMTEWAPHKTIHLFDTFTGIPVQGPRDWHGIGAFNDTELDRVREAFKNTNAVFHVGIFPETIPKEETKYACVHLDCDQYQPMLEALEYFYPRVVPGGYLVIDDYKYELCRGVEAALEAFCELERITFSTPAPHQAVIHKGERDAA